MNDFSSIAEGTRVLHVRIGHGDITIRSAETGWALEWSGDDAPVVERDGQVLRVKQRDDIWRGQQNIWLTVPSTIDFADLHTGSGNIESNGLACPVKINTGNGNGLVSQHVGGVDLHTGKGNVEVSDSYGTLSIDSGHGNIRLTNVGEKATVKTGKGNIIIIAARNLAAEIESGYGNLSVEGGSLRGLSFQTGKGRVLSTAHMQPGSYEFESGMGGVEIGLPATTRARVEAQTGSGGVQSDFPLVRVGRTGPMSFGGGRMVGSIGEGDATTFITIKTGMGGITLRRLGAFEPERAFVPQPVYVAAAQPSEPRIVDAPVQYAEPRIVDAPAQQAEPRIVDAAPAAPSASPTPNLTLVILESLARGEISPSEADALLNQIRQRK